ncbi:hypothetical protein AVEN_267727-1 [Araneus ventricosus]|uniref:Uncharacterized protein n=1 Tax=Araneus ventricosus TaxID=182803 RepID=A0A4Y2CVR0_ARAVE|nr:hypothetical protein AVEN_267727-1 [Araneus ventricosus]
MRRGGVAFSGWYLPDQSEKEATPWTDSRPICKGCYVVGSFNPGGFVLLGVSSGLFWGTFRLTQKVAEDVGIVGHSVISLRVKKEMLQRKA